MQLRNIRRLRVAQVCARSRYHVLILVQQAQDTASSSDPTSSDPAQIAPAQGTVISALAVQTLQDACQQFNHQFHQYQIPLDDKNLFHFKPLGILICTICQYGIKPAESHASSPSPTVNNVLMHPKEQGHCHCRLSVPELEVEEVRLLEVIGPLYIISYAKVKATLVSNTAAIPAIPYLRPLKELL